MLKYSFYFGVKFNRGGKIINFDLLYYRFCIVNFIGLMFIVILEMGIKFGFIGSLCCFVREV